MNSTNYIIKTRTKRYLILQDVGPHDRYMTITNAAEDVVQELLSSGDLVLGQRLFYYDTEGSLDELVIRNGRFAGFQPGKIPRDE